MLVINSSSRNFHQRLLFPTYSENRWIFYNDIMVKWIAWMAKTGTFLDEIVQLRTLKRILLAILNDNFAHNKIDAKIANQCQFIIFLLFQTWKSSESIFKIQSKFISLLVFEQAIFCIFSFNRENLKVQIT